MDETNTATSSSAAAVADGASAAASTKTVNTASTSTKPSSYVKLLIKASNQQFDDQVIESDFSWTVKRLKAHLSIVYPSKPPVADQKLIYSGQLLNDNLQLKDVIRSYKDVYTQNHIIHLVYTPKNLPPISAASSALKKMKTSAATGSENMTSEEGLRQRHTTPNSGSVTSDGVSRPGQQIPPEHISYYSQYLPQTFFANSSGLCPPVPQNQIQGYGQFNMHAIAMQQTAMYSWMQQVYSQYMEQCLRVSNSVNGIHNANVTQSGVAGSMPANYPTFPQYFLPNFPQSVIPPVAQSTQLNAATSAAANQQVQPPQQPEQPAQAQVAAPRFPNVPQEEADNRDWLDNIFSITRFALFLTILYFNSSPFRCLAVVIIAGGIYLYHIGVFRFRHERNNNNLNRNNNAAQNAAVDQIRQGVDQQQPQREQGAVQPDQGNNVAENNQEDNALADVAADGNEQHPQPSTTNSNTPDISDGAPNNNNESMISTMRTFVVTFFTSLLPETPAV